MEGESIALKVNLLVNAKIAVRGHSVVITHSILRVSLLQLDSPIFSKGR
jgi:hypothetical protein